MSKEALLNIAFTTSDQSIPSATVEIASGLTETNRNTDVYFYKLLGGELFSPTHKKRVVDVTIGERDKNLVRSLETWAVNNCEGKAVWISPPLESTETATKITFFEILNGRNYKMIKNISVLVDSFENTGELESFTNFIYSCSINPLERVENFSTLRGDLIIIHPNHKEEALSELERYIDFEKAWEKYSGHVKDAVFIIKSSRTVQERCESITRFAGSSSLGCATVSGKSAEKKGKKTERQKTLKCTCPICHQHVTATVTAGRIYCPLCGGSAPYTC